ncbi:DUF4174 domain-containing protein [Frigidibacter sp. MR17.14]|uniref:DUF4174 domain-containing protein n=1 Tax=Frigidibacter sp. MR17.14 TaxID=3126509 RepID=UPI00301313CA
MLSRLLTPVLFAATALSVEAAPLRSLSPDRGDLDDFRWQARPVLIFAPSADDPQYRAAMAALQARSAALAERRIVVLSDTAPEAAGRLRTGFGVEGFRMLLVGLDGGVKMDEARPIAIETLLDTIDRMPMRQGQRVEG